MIIYVNWLCSIWERWVVLVYVNSIACNGICKTHILLLLHDTLKRYGFMNIFMKRIIQQVKDIKLMHHHDP